MMIGLRRLSPFVYTGEMEKYVNSVMQEINELITELYEAMMDNDSKEVQKIIDKIIPQLRDIKSTFTDEQT